MRKILILLAITLTMASCSTTNKLSNNAPSPENTTISSGRDGSSFEKAIVITEKSESKGVGAEYEWLRKNYPGYKSQGQSLTYDQKKPYDIIDIITSDGEAKSIYFDISNFFGKF
ncbi:putative periplasmic lipoprotein [Mangrovibacterium diazotrophicum]|uniref:Lipoprotein n=1 Tax=Mangrovibacterium diazotrophicum TaxID=1261403 RepID=A0A419W406_9BACT|nr:hypothetical protein [Mangrovibacterium diazotrophicum]RKD90182.1 hypothetical protein BC643_0518 [Mangrovibacterium diazotrophicum]